MVHVKKTSNPKHCGQRTWTSTSPKREHKRPKINEKIHNLISNQGDLNWNHCGIPFSSQHIGTAEVSSNKCCRSWKPVDFWSESKLQPIYKTHWLYLVNLKVLFGLPTPLQVCTPEKLFYIKPGGCNIHRII